MILAIVAALLIPVMFILMLPSLLFGGLGIASAEGSAEALLNDSSALTENLTRIVNSINAVLDEGIEDVKARIEQDFATRTADNYEIVNPYEDHPPSNTSAFLAQYCAAKEADWTSISISDMEQIIRDGKQHLYPFTYTTEEREIEDDPETEEDESGTELWYVYTIVYQGETYFADTIFHLTDEQKELAGNFAQNLNLFLSGSAGTG